MWNSEKIIKIEEGSFKKNPKDSNYAIFDGYLVITDKQTIKIGMNMNQGCCERPGYFWSVEDVSEFVGAELQSIEIVDKELNKERLDKEIHNSYEGGVMFVNFNTDKGILQFTAYNEQNGYYGHDAIVISEQLTKEERL